MFLKLCVTCIYFSIDFSIDFNIDFDYYSTAVSDRQHLLVMAKV